MTLSSTVTVLKDLNKKNMRYRPLKRRKFDVITANPLHADPFMKMMPWREEVGGSGRRYFWGLLFVCLLGGNAGQVLDMKELGVRRSACQDLMTKGTSDEVVLAWRQKDCDFLSSRAENGREVVPYQYRYLGYAAMVQRMQYLQLIYPEYISLYAAQAKYNLPVVGTCSEDTRYVL